MTQRLHDLIRDIIEKSPHLTQRGLAERMDLNPAAINRMLFGARRIKAEELPIIESYLGVRLDVPYPQGAPEHPARGRGFSEGAPMPPGYEANAPVPVYGYAAGSAPSGKGSGLNLTNGEVVDWAPRHPLLTGIRDAFAIYVFSDSMEPRYFRGELVYVHPGRPAEAGKDCVIEMKNGDAYIKQFVKRGDTKITVRQYNPAGQSEVPLKDIKAIYAVIGRG